MLTASFHAFIGHLWVCLFVCFWRNVYSNPLPILKLGCPILFCFLRQGVIIYPGLTLNLQSSFFSLLSARIIGVHHHTLAVGLPFCC
jgi:hypothetical protein